MKSNLDILITYYNKPEHLLQRCLNSIKNINNLILIVDDSSNLEYQELLHKNAKILKNYKIIRTPKNIKQAGATYYGLTFLRNKFVIRLDADDIYQNIPLNVPEDFDIFARTISAKTIDEWIDGKQAMFNGIILKQEIMRDLFSEWFQMFREYGYYHEDVYNFAKMLLKYPKLKWGETDVNLIYKKNKWSVSYEIQNLGKKFNRLNILYLLCIRLGIDSNEFNKLAKKFQKKD